MKTSSIYRSIFDDAFEGLAYCKMIFDKQNHPIDFIYIQVNKNFENLTGLKDVQGKRVSELIPGIRDSNPALFDTYGRVSLHKKTESFEIYLKALKRWFLVSAYSPKKNYFVASFQNITKRKNIEKDLIDARTAARNVMDDLQTERGLLAAAIAKDEAMLASIGDGVIFVDLVGQITFMNASAQHILCYQSNKDVVGKMLFDMVVVENEVGQRLSQSERPMSLAMAGNTSVKGGGKKRIVQPKVFHGIYYYVRKNKTRLPVAVTVSPVMLGRKVVGAIEVFRDITHERQIDKAKSEFVSLASHQLKTPPTAIKLLTERLLNKKVGDLTSKQREYFEDIRVANQRMIDLINALLNVSRIDLGAFNMQFEKKDIGAIVQNVFDELKPDFDKKEIRLQEHYQAKGVLVMLDESMFRIVVSNLAVNAINYTSRGGKIIVECHRMVKGKVFGQKTLKKDCFAMSIADTGYGIPKNQQSKLFTKFFRADNAREKHPDGTGLGLYVVKSVLDHSKGSIWFTSKENHGTVFYITLPLVASN